MILLLSLATVSAADIDLDEYDINKITLTQNIEKTLNYDKETYTIIPDLVNENELKLTFSPNNLAITIKKESSAEVDINNDQTPDFEISYLVNVDKTATIEFKKPETTENSTEGEELEVPNKVKEAMAMIKENMKLLLGGIVVLIILMIIVKRSKRVNTEKLYRKAESLHREAKEFHDDGDDETASELYEKAEELREKAREMENQEV